MRCPALCAAVQRRSAPPPHTSLPQTQLTAARPTDVYVCASLQTKQVSDWFGGGGCADGAECRAVARALLARCIESAASASASTSASSNTGGCFDLSAAVCQPMSWKLAAAIVGYGACHHPLPTTISSHLISSHLRACVVCRLTHSIPETDVSAAAHVTTALSQFLHAPFTAATFAAARKAFDQSLPLGESQTDRGTSPVVCKSSLMVCVVWCGVVWCGVVQCVSGGSCIGAHPTRSVCYRNGRIRRRLRPNQNCTSTVCCCSLRYERCTAVRCVRCIALTCVCHVCVIDS